MGGFGWDDLLSIPTAGLYSGIKAATGGYSEGGTTPLEWMSGQAGDFMNVGKNRYQTGTYNMDTPEYGGKYGADNLADVGLQNMYASQRGGQFAQNQFQGNRGPQAMEDRELANREAASRYGDQAGSVQLAREAALGQAPSQAAYQLQSGLDRSLAQQQAIAGGARGNAGIALASANANAAGANLQNQAFNQAGQLRAQEMADARNLYGGLASNMRSQDQNRLQMGNQMSQYNAGLNDQYRLGMGQLANQYNQSGLGWYQASMNPYDKQGQLGMQTGMTNADSYNQAEARRAGISQANTDARARQNDRLWSFGTTATGIGGSIVGANGGAKPPPPNG